jgi:YesN/AraC family two-component response regulator
MFQCSGPRPRGGSDDQLVLPGRIAHPDRRPPAIVVVDDEPDVLAILHRLMRDVAFPYDIVAVNNGDAALDQIELYPVPLLITDYNMPHMDGLQLIEAVKATSPGTCVVLITAYATPELERRARAARVDYYLVKPFPLDRIEGIVRDTLLPL